LAQCFACLSVCVCARLTVVSKIGVIESSCAHRTVTLMYVGIGLGVETSSNRTGSGWLMLTFAMPVPELLTRPATVATKR
jgi:hypothetical protein